MTSTTEVGRNLPVLDTSVRASGGCDCGCGGCVCGTAASSTGATPTTATSSTEQEIDMSVPTAAQSHTQTYSVTGMTCGHCVASVTEELHGLPGVDQVDVDLVAGGTSTVTVTSTQPLTDDAVQAAVEEAGYQLA